MEKLTKEADGYYRTPSGFVAVMPRFPSGITRDGMNWFEFRTDAFSDIIRVEWPQGAPVALFEGDVSMAMIRLNFGRNITDVIMEEFNALVDEQGPGSGEPAKVTKRPSPKGLAPEAPASDPAPGAPAAEPEAGFPPEGWLPHPEAPGYFYKGQEVLTEAVLRERMAVPDAPAT